MPQHGNHTNISKTTTMDEYLRTEASNIIAASFMSVANLITYHQGYQHYRFNKKQQERRRILYILQIVLIHGFHSFPLIITHPDYIIHILNIRDCYGSFALYNFLVLCYEYLGGEGNVMTLLSGRPVPASWVNSAKIYTDRFHRFCKFAVMQFFITKLICTFIIYVMLESGRGYRGGDWSDVGYICITVVTNTSAALALYALSIFIKAVRNFIKPDPTLQFFVITSLVYLTYWQQLVLEVLENVGVLASATDASGRPVVGIASENCNGFLVCIESLGAAIALRIAFSVPENRPDATVTMKASSTNSLNSLL